MLNDLYATLLKTNPVTQTQKSIKGRAVVKFRISDNGIIDPNSITVFSNKSVPEEYLDAAIECGLWLHNKAPAARGGPQALCRLYGNE